MKLSELHAFLNAQPWAVEATCSSAGTPQAAVIGVAITDQLELVFDTLKSSRKHANLLQRPTVALVIGWDGAVTAQIEGAVDQPVGAELVRVKDCYFGRFSDGRAREASSEVAYWRVRPYWIRYSDFNVDPPFIAEWGPEELIR